MRNILFFLIAAVFGYTSATAQNSVKQNVKYTKAVQFTGFPIVQDTVLNITGGGDTIRIFSRGDTCHLLSTAGVLKISPAPAGSVTSAAGAATQIQFNTGGSFAADSAFFFYRAGSTPVLEVYDTGQAKGIIATKTFAAIADDGAQFTIKLPDGLGSDVNAQLPTSAPDSSGVLGSDENHNWYWGHGQLRLRADSLTAAGDTITLTANRYNAFKSSGTVTALQLVFPPLPNAADVVEVKFCHAVTTITIDGNGKTVNGQLSAATAGLYCKWTYDATTGAWF